MAVAILILSWILAAAALAGSVYQLVALTLVRRFMAERRPDPRARPPVSLLKPLCGTEPGLEANLRTFCRQDYPDYQIVFGVHTADDSALPIARALQREFAGMVDIAIMVGRGRPESGNPKIANLLDLMPGVRHDVLILSDSDMSVPPDYIDCVLAALEMPGAGLSTALYIGDPGEGIWSRLGAMGINHGFLPSVMVAQVLGRRDGCFGATIALDRQTLEKIGGFEALREQLADDYLLGAAVRARGGAIGLARCLPHSVVYEPDFTTLFAHEVRWGRTLASIDPVGYAASVVTMPVPLALLALVAAGVAAGSGGTSLAACWGPAVLGVVLALVARIAVVRREARVLGVEKPPGWLVLVRDLLSLGVQVVAVSGRTVSWRGRRFRIDRQGVMSPLGES